MGAGGGGWGWGGVQTPVVVIIIPLGNSQPLQQFMVMLTRLVVMAATHLAPPRLIYDGTLMKLQLPWRR